MKYSFKQQSVFLLALMSFIALWLIGMAFFGELTWSEASSSAAFFVLIGMYFSSMTIETREDSLCHYFGFGGKIWRRKWADITAVSVVRNKWYWGWGIRLTPHGWLFNVSGLDAVELKLRNGKCVRLGCDHPEELKNIIESNL